MATLREYFDGDVKMLNAFVQWSVHSNEGELVDNIIAKIAYDFEGGCKYWYFYIPNQLNLNVVGSIFAKTETKLCTIKLDGDGAEIFAGEYSYLDPISSSELIFTKRIILYVDRLLGSERRRHVREIGEKCGFHVVVRDREYAEKRSLAERPLAFISHDARDKDEIVRELASKLSLSMCPVWYDEYSLNVGDNLRESIESGLKQTQKCIIIISKNFISNQGWGRVEFESIFMREIIEKQKVILPIWHNVTVREVYEFSPKLSNIFALDSGVGIEELSKRLIASIRRD